MWFALMWMAILAVDLLVWALFTQCPRFHLQSYRFSYLRRPLIISVDGEGKRKEVLDRAVRAIIPKKVEIGGLTPPSNIRTIIAAVILLQNSLAMGIVDSENAAQTICRLSGQLALVNTIPLVLLAFPDLVLGRLVSQCGPEIIWAHHLFGWLVWLDAVVHVGLSRVGPVDSSE